MRPTDTHKDEAAAISQLEWQRVDHFRDASGKIRVSPGDVRRVAAPGNWTEFQKALDEKAVVVGTVTRVVKGGLLVDIGSPAFLPASRCGTSSASERKKLVGQAISCRITKLAAESGGIEVDRRGVLEEFARATENAVTASRSNMAAKADAGGHVEDGLLERYHSLTDSSLLRPLSPAEASELADVNRRLDAIERSRSAETEAQQGESANERLLSALNRIEDYLRAENE